MDYLKEILKILCSKCSCSSVKRKQKMLAKITISLISNLEIPNSMLEFISCLKTLCSLHNQFPEEPGNIIVNILHYEKYPTLKNIILEAQKNTITSENIDGFLELIQVKIRSSEIHNKIDYMVKKLLSIKDSDNDIEVVEEFNRAIHKEYLQILQVQDKNTQTEIKISSEDEKLIDIISALAKEAKNRNRLPSGIKSLDNFLKSGFESTRIYIFGGKPGLGKSALLLNFFLNGIKQIKHPKEKKRDIIVYITLENDLIETFERIVSITTMQETTLTDVSDDEIISIINSVKTFYPNGELRVKYMIPYTTTTMDIFLYIDKLSEEYNVLGVFVDYLNLVSSAEKTKNMEKRFELGFVTAELKVLAKKFQCPVVVPAQLNTQGYDGIPTMKNLDESRQIAQNADFVGLMFEVPQEKIPPQLLYNYPSDKYGIIGINIDKNRNGPTGLSFLLGHKSIFYFESLDKITEKSIINKLYNRETTQNNHKSANYYQPREENYSNIVSPPISPPTSNPNTLIDNNKFMNTGYE